MVRFFCLLLVFTGSIAHADPVFRDKDGDFWVLLPNTVEPQNVKLKRDYRPYRYVGDSVFVDKDGDFWVLQPNSLEPQNVKLKREYGPYELVRGSANER